MYQYNLTKHVKKCHKSPKNHECGLCSRTFISAKELEMHIKIKHQCKICSKFFKNGRRLNKHLREKHDSNSLFKCEFCDKSYVDSTRVKIHMKSKHLAEINNECHLPKTKSNKKYH